MSPGWAQLVEQGKVHLIETERGALSSLGELGFGINTIPAGYWQNLASNVDTLDFSDFIVLVRADMADDLAHLITWCLAERRAGIERQYRHLPRERSPLTYPIEPAQMAKSPIPLHPGAARYYSEAGLI